MENKEEERITKIQKYIRNMSLNNKGNFTVFSIGHLSHFIENRHLTLNDLNEVRKELNTCKIKLKSLDLSKVQLNHNEDPIIHRTYSASGEDRMMANFSRPENNSDKTLPLISLLSEQTKLQHINLSGQCFNSKEIHKILKIISENCLEVTELNLSGNNLSIIKKNGTTYDGLQILIEKIIKKHKEIKLKKLWLERCCLDQNSLTRLCDALKDHPFMRLLYINHNTVAENDLITILDKLLRKNDRLIEVAYYLSTIPTISTHIDCLLANNKNKQKYLHSSLLSQEKRKGEALSALKNDKEKWFKLIVGCNYPMQDQEQFLEMEKKFFYMHVKASIECIALQNLLNDLEKTQNQFDINKFLKNTRSEILKYIAEVFNVNQDKAENIFLNNDLVESYGNLEQLIKNLKNNWNNGIAKIQNVLAKSRDNKNQCDRFFNKIISSLKSKHEELSMEAEKIWEDLYDILDARFVEQNYCNFVEEVKEALLSEGIDVNDPIDSSGNTLLHEAFSHNRLWAVKFLLDRGADPLKNNANGVSVFLSALMKSEAINEDSNNTVDWLVLNYIDKALEFLWPNTIELTVSKKEAELIGKLKSFFQDYSKKILERKTQSSLMYFINFHWLFIESRQKELSEHLRILRQTLDTDKVNNIVENLKKAIALSNSAKRGLLGKTELNDGAREILDQLLTIVENEHKEATLSIGNKSSNFYLTNTVLPERNRNIGTEQIEKAREYYASGKAAFYQENITDAIKFFQRAKDEYKDALDIPEIDQKNKAKIENRLSKLKNPDGKYSPTNLRKVGLKK